MLRSDIVNCAGACIGTMENTPRHDTILKIYNDYADKKKLYHMTRKDPWCATFVSAVFIATGNSEKIPIECSCQRMIDKSKTMGIWVENDAYRPKEGDIIMYDWDDNGKGDCVGRADHVGIIENVYYDNMVVIEGNKSNSVSRRRININARYIRGYICPRYDA